MILGRFQSLQKEPGRLVGPGDLPLRQQQNRDINPGLCSTCTRSSAYIQAHSLALHWMPGTAAESGLRVKSCIALPSTDFIPIRPTQVYQKGDQISAFSSSLWTLSLSIPLGKSALLFCVSSYHNADSVSPLICNMFCFLCKKKKKKKEMFCFLPCESSYAVYCLLSHSHCIVLLLLSAKWC